MGNTFSSILWNMDIASLRYLCERYEISLFGGEQRGDIITKILNELDLNDFELVFPKGTKANLTMNRNSALLGITQLVNGQAQVQCKSCDK